MIFVEDVAICTDKCAIITNPGAKSINGEIKDIEPAIRKYFADENVRHIVSPGKLDGGDVMMICNHLIVGAGNIGGVAEAVATTFNLYMMVMATIFTDICK